MQNKLAKLSFGHIAAEEEAEELREYFLETSEYAELVRNDRKFIVVGRKGSGKSAIYVNLRDSFSKQKNASVIALQLDNYPWAIHKKIYDETGAAQRSYVASWTYLILIELTKQLLEYEKPVRYKFWDRSFWIHRINANRRKLSRYMRDKYGKLAPSVGELYAERLRSLSNVQIGTVSADSEIRERDFQLLRDSILEERKVLQELVLNVLPKHNTHFVLFDQLDRAWDNETDTKQMLIGLLLASRDLLRSADQLGKKLRIVIFLRDDIYEQLRFEDKNKLSPDIVKLIWNDSALKALLEQRMRKTANLSWDDVFASTVVRNRQLPFGFMLKRTLLRPRDIINFCVLSLAHAKEQNHNKIEKDDISFAETSHSEFMRNEYRDEAQATHPYFDTLLEIIRELGTSSFKPSQFVDTYNAKEKTEKDLNYLSSDGALTILVELSILGVRKPQPQGGRPYLYRYQVEPTVRLEPKEIVQVHPCLVKVLNLSETTLRDLEEDEE